MLILLISQDALESKMLSDLKIPIYGVKKKIYTARKVSVFGAFLVRIFPHSDWIRRDTQYLSVFSPKAGNKDQKNSEYGYFSRSDMVTSSFIPLTIAYFKPCERSMMEHFCDNNYQLLAIDYFWK